MKIALAILLVLILIIAGCSLFHKPPAINTDTHIGTPAATSQSNADKTAAVTVSMTRWLILLCLVGIGVSGALLLTGSKYGVIGLAASGITLIAAITVTQHLVLISWIGLAIVLGVAGLLIYQIVVNKKALSEIIATVEASKVVLTDDLKAKIFGTAGIANLVQSDSTKAVVDSEQAKNI